jgi:aminoglycoside phosphotransferase (APT) family kinase protein
MRTNPKSDDLATQAISIARDLFGRTPSLRKCQSEVNYCTVLSFDDGTADRVIKLAKLKPFAIEIEAYLYPRMRKAGLPVPEVEFTNDDYSGAAAPFIVMPKFSDTTMADLCTESNTSVEAASASSGRFINEFHGQFVDEYEDFLSAHRLGAQKREVNAGLDDLLDFELIRASDPELLETIEAYLADLTRPETRHLIHGQPHTRNIVVNPLGEICVVDFGESIGMGCPLRDLYMLLTSHDGWARGTGDPSERTAIIEGYGGINALEHRELLYWEADRGVVILNQLLQMADRSGAPDSLSHRINRSKRNVRRICSGEGLVTSLPHHQ